MAKFVNDDAPDAYLEYIAECDELIACSQQPTDFTEATSTYALGDYAITSGDGNGDFTIANGDVSGRKLTIAAQSGGTADANGDATHIALVDAGTSTLRLVTTCPSETLVSGNSFETEAFDIEVGDPT